MLEKCSKDKQNSLHPLLSLLGSVNIGRWSLWQIGNNWCRYIVDCSQDGPNSFI